ncbi:hypothetical protein GM415_06325 [Pseudodesulfovibrio cashew]|uniref:Uncharacterized protein n=1 Tax=Pseudodesulfovibrio cashew TaxID=2678688 RepID=A0A6I6JF89_9BACT|nr:hypothetical protein [Pseudodesulfovibrio cashew]QGY39750.1 hypothetical protein GM415_06325 [Pseudodesulfovibrio cashew]
MDEILASEHRGEDTPPSAFSFVYFFWRSKRNGPRREGMEGFWERSSQTRLSLRKAKPEGGGAARSNTDSPALQARFPKEEKQNTSTEKELPPLPEKVGAALQ